MTILVNTNYVVTWDLWRILGIKCLILRPFKWCYPSTGYIVKNTLGSKVNWLLYIIWGVLVRTFVMNRPRNGLRNHISTIWILRLVILRPWIIRVKWLTWLTWVFRINWNHGMLNMNCNGGSALDHFGWNITIS